MGSNYSELFYATNSDIYVTKTVNIEVYNEDRNVFGVATEHNPDLPKPFDKFLQQWVQDNFDELAEGESVQEAAVLEYEPNEEIIEIRKL